MESDTREYKCGYCGKIGCGGYGSIIVGRDPNFGPWCKRCGMSDRMVIYNKFWGGGNSMQIDRTPDPVVRHSAVVVHRKRFRAIQKAFEKQIVATCDRMVGSKTFEVTEENLLIQRKALVARIKKGMLARKDLEAEIAALAAIVWFLRLSKDRQDRITDGW